MQAVRKAIYFTDAELNIIENVVRVVADDNSLSEYDNKAIKSGHNKLFRELYRREA